MTASAGHYAPMGAQQSDGEEYLGMVKSYNARRGFGFIACEATAAKFGRDVYIAKAEVQLLAASEGHVPPPPSHTGEKPPPPSLEEEDLVRFYVKLSAEGYPQAEHIRRVRKFHGTVLEPPGEAATDDEAPFGRIASDDLAAARGIRDAIVRRASCGRARLAAGDRVTFCLQDQGPTYTISGEMVVDALLVMLVPRPQHNIGCILGCCILNLPRTPAPGGWGGYRPDLQLDCHALGDRIILSGLPQDVDQSELMRFFSKHGATQVGVAVSRAGAFASVAFPGMSEVARFMARSKHTFADDKETRLARLLPRCACNAPQGPNGAVRLPGLPAPMIAPGNEAGVLVVTWSPVVLATGYLVELRPAGVQAQWSVVDASEGKLGGGEGGRFGRDCSSCKVSGLPSNVVFEARVTYATSCGCSSDASDPSEWCLAFPQAAPQVSPMSYNNNFTVQTQAAAGMGGQQMAWPMQVQSPMQCSSWRCVHGMMTLQPPAPEVRAADEYGFSLLVQWPSVGTATAYVVELRESGSPHAERFVRQVPMQAVGSLVELRIGGLRPTGPGRIYIAQVRSVSGCGCESDLSPPGVSQPMGMPGSMSQQQLQQQLPYEVQLPTLSLASACPPPLPRCGANAPTYSPTALTGATVPPSLMPPMTSMAALQQYEPELVQMEQAKLAPWQISGGMKTAGTAPSHGGLPSLLQSSRGQMAPPPSGNAPEVVTAHKEIAPEVTPNDDMDDEECIILD